MAFQMALAEKKEIGNSGTFGDGAVEVGPGGVLWAR
jgi:hypothetical protein